MKRALSLSSVVIAVFGGAALFVSTLPAFAMDMKGTAPPAAAPPGHQTDQPVRGTGVVKAVDKARGTVTLAHDPIKSLNWPAMTMGFKVKDKTLLDNVKPGSKVDFTLVQAGKDYIVTSIK